MSPTRNVLLIGASGGVGQAVALDLAAAGFRIALHGWQQPDVLASLCERIKNEGGEAESFQADITDEAAVEKLVAEVTSSFGPIDILINNAGVTRSGMSWKLSLDDWQDTLAVNLTGPFLCTKHVLAGMRERGWGRIINITSVVAQTGFPGTSAYAASKAGLIGLTKSIAKETANKGVTANCLALGYFNAGMLFEIPEEMRENIRESIPQREFGETGTISTSIAFLCTDAAGYITGQTLNLNGGLH